MINMNGNEKFEVIAMGSFVLDDDELNGGATVPEESRPEQENNINHQTNNNIEIDLTNDDPLELQTWEEIIHVNSASTRKILRAKELRATESKEDSERRRAHIKESCRIYRLFSSIQKSAEPTKYKNASEVSSDEYKFYTEAYRDVSTIRFRRIHCTSCRKHIGTAPGNEHLIRMHPILRVTQCKKCYDFYNSGEFDKGADGSEYHCRWCGQGGKVFCCTKCPFVFCKSCISKNLGLETATIIEKNNKWSCFSCSPLILWHLRAQHWALMSYIHNQKRTIFSISRTNEEIVELMLLDMTRCCQRHKKVDKHLMSSRSTTNGDNSSPEMNCTNFNEQFQNEHLSNQPKTTARIPPFNCATNTSINNIPIPIEISLPNATPANQLDFNLTTSPMPSNSHTSTVQFFQYQAEIVKAMEHCCSLVTRIQTIQNSMINNVASNQLKRELYTPLSHLLTYANESFQHLQIKCSNDMRELNPNASSPGGQQISNATVPNAINGSSVPDGSINCGYDINSFIAAGLLEVELNEQSINSLPSADVNAKNQMQTEKSGKTRKRKKRMQTNKKTTVLDGGGEGGDCQHLKDLIENDEKLKMNCKIKLRRLSKKERKEFQSGALIPSKGKNQKKAIFTPKTPFNKQMKSNATKLDPDPKLEMDCFISLPKVDCSPSASSTLLKSKPFDINQFKIKDEFEESNETEQQNGNENENCSFLRSGKRKIATMNGYRKRKRKRKSIENFINGRI